MAEVEQIRLGIFQVNCYFLHQDKHILCIDPCANMKRIEQYLLQYPDHILDGICLTHGHFDHIGAVDDLVRKYQCPIYLSKEDEYLATHKEVNFMGNRFATITSKITTYPSNHVTIGVFDLSVYDTPGHTEGSVCLGWKQYLFTGDTLFKESVGRTDLYGGSNVKLKQSLELLKQLNPDYLIYPGHSEHSTLQQELLNNPYLQ